LVEVPERAAEAFERATSGVPRAWIGRVTGDNNLKIYDAEFAGDTAATGALLVDAPVSELKEAWQRPLDW
jgi:hypothetical protein